MADEEGDDSFGPELDWNEAAFSQVDSFSQPPFLQHDAAQQPHSEGSAAPATAVARSATASARVNTSSTSATMGTNPEAHPGHIAIAYDPPLPSVAEGSAVACVGAQATKAALVDDWLLSDLAETGFEFTGDEAEESQARSGDPPPEQRSLYDRFRKRRRYLSVSDLAATRWCEMQVEYGLIGRRSARPEDRPATIRTSSGRQIAVDQSRVVSRQAILDAGIKVHDRLEREIAPKMIHVDVTSREDEWGLKILNTIVSLDCLLRDGMAREIPVWGFIDRFLVLGVIDQIDLQRIRPPMPPPDPRKDPGKLDYFFKPSTKETDEAPKPPSFQHRVFISDSKTRYSKTIPQSSQSESSRLQLMLYKWLFDRLASSSHSHDALWEQMSLSPTEPFTPSFVQQIRPIIQGSDLANSVGRARNLAELARVLDAFWRQVGGAESRLEIVYRLRGDDETPKRKGKRALESRAKASAEEQAAHSTAIAASLADILPATIGDVTNGVEGLAGPTDDGDTELQKAIVMSLEEVHETADRQAAQAEEAADFARKGEETPRPPEAGIFNGHVGTPALSQERSATSPRRSKRLAGKTAADGPVTTPSAKRSRSTDSPKSTPTRLKASTAPTKPAAGIATTPQTPRAKEPGVIGTVGFQYDEPALLEFVKIAGQFWMGERPATGVSEEETRRCHSCEFAEGCEWRATKALEAMERQRAVKRAFEEKRQASLAAGRQVAVQRRNTALRTSVVQERFGSPAE